MKHSDDIKIYVTDNYFKNFIEIKPNIVIDKIYNGPERITKIKPAKNKSHIE